jgi:hypothetical protein
MPYRFVSVPATEPPRTQRPYPFVAKLPDDTLMLSA